MNGARTTIRDRRVRLRPDLCPGSPAGRPTARGGRPRRTRHLPLHSAGGARLADRRPGYRRARTASGRTRPSARLRHRCDRLDSIPRTVRRPVQLPNLSAWNETCASYGGALEPADVPAAPGRALPGPARAHALQRVPRWRVADGSRFFYQNPLMWYGNYERFEWINTPCCPPNVVRLIASLGNYSTRPAGAMSTSTCSSAAPRARQSTIGRGLRQQTTYPWDGRVRFSVSPIERSGSPST